MSIQAPPNRPDLTSHPLYVQGSELLPPGSPVLVAVAADQWTGSILKVADALASQRDVAPTLLYVMELTPYAMADGNFATVNVLDTLLDTKGLRSDEEHLRVTCGANVGAAAQWPFAIELGESASSIVSHARKIGAKCILMGFHRHGAVSRALGADTLREVMILGGVPVLAVQTSLTTLPKSVVIAMDFSQASVRAALLARNIMDAHGTMHLVYIDSSERGIVPEAEEGERLIKANGIPAAFEQVIAALDPMPGMTIVPVQRPGIPLLTLPSVCDELHPELVAIGSQRHPFLERLRLGSVATRMVKEGRWSMLVTPPGYASSHSESGNP